jgi:NHLM bacteriocin system ABC transporter ATP-binding protein
MGQMSESLKEALENCPSAKKEHPGSFELGEEEAFFVLSGALDIFAVEKEAQDRHSGGRKHQLFRVGAGEAVWSTSSMGTPFIALMATAAPGTRTARCKKETLDRLFEGRNNELTTLSGQWLHHLLSAFDPSLPPSLPPPVVSLSEFWPALAAFHSSVAPHLEAGIRRRAEEERQMLMLRGEGGVRAMHRALSRLSSVINPETPEPPEAGESPEYLLYRTCRLIGERMGVQFRPSKTLEGIGQASRVRTRKVMLRGDWWVRESGPMLGYIEEDRRPVALLPTPSLGYEVVDVGRGLHFPVDSRNAASLSPFAHTFYLPLADRAVTALDLIAFGLEACSGIDLVKIPLIGIAVGVLGLLVPVATGVIFDSIIPGTERRQLFHISLVLFAMVFSTGLLEAAKGLAFLRTETKISAATQAGIWDRILSLPVSFFRQYLAGDLAVRSLGIEEIREVLTGSVVSSVMTGIFSIFSLFLLLYYDWRLALMAFGLLLLALIVTVLLALLELRYQRTLQEMEGKIAGLVFQLIAGISKLRVAAAESRAFAIWAEAFAAQKSLGIKARTLSNWLAVFDSAFPVISSLFLFIVIFARGGGAGATHMGTLSTGEFIAFNAAFGTFLAAGLEMGVAALSVIRIVPLYERARPILETPPEVDEERADPGELTGEVEMTHVSFRYDPDGSLILNDISLRVKAGEFAAFVGPSGAGKSTVLRLLLGFETPETGSIYYNGQDSAGLDVQKVRRQMGVVVQNSQVLPGSIFSNIVGSAPLSLDDAWAAARMAGLDQDIERMPMEMHTFVPEGGSTFSGGQRQRLLIARALVKKPRILLFDEATSALDNKTQAQVSESLEKLRVTRIVIAHRLSTIRNADCIYVLSGGRIVDTGKYEELMSRPGPFMELASRQLI